MPPQIFGDQPLILKRLAEVSANQGSNFLEVGSWCGDSTLILGEVAKKRNGHLFCVDWWKGNPGTELDEIAKKQDIFALFWRRVLSAGLDDVVIPIRSRSEFVFTVLAKESFSFVFIDGDHTYQAVLDDIRNYAPLVGRGGILCGHDCEGFIGDFDEGFLERGRDLDYYETVHCGVVLAVGQSFEKYSIDNSIWSVISIGNGQWASTSLEFGGLKRKPQEPPPAIADIHDHHIFRYRKRVYAVPFSLGLTDITDENLRNHPEVFDAGSVVAAEELILKQTGGCQARESRGPKMPCPETVHPARLLRHQEDTTAELQQTLQAQQVLLSEKQAKIEELYGGIAEREALTAQLQGMLQVHQALLCEKETKIEEMYRTIAEREATSAGLQQTLQAHEVLLAEKQTKIEELCRIIGGREAEIQSLKIELEKLEITLELSRLS